MIKLSLRRVFGLAMAIVLAGSMADHVDDEIVSFDDLDPDEQNVCVLMANAVLAVLCLLLAAVV